ncbi:MAG: hypothetical protein ABIB79_02530, partial [archaeon]
MCNLCKTKPVYVFTNKRQVCKTCFIRFFQKKFLYINRKFGLMKKRDVIGYQKSNTPGSVVLENLLKMFEGKFMINVVKLRSQNARDIDIKSLIKKSSIRTISAKDRDRVRSGATHKRGKAEPNFKIALPSTTDTETYSIIHNLISGKTQKSKPLEGQTIKPLYLFTNKQVELYAKLKGL